MALARLGFSATNKRIIVKLSRNLTACCAYKRLKKGVVLQLI
ncbi:hypothetical protein X781_10950 [Mannheimia sp. USDA-ARS-USMARC-1261]|nr:hypothetical protein X781_10950 [Mannheimia sp. USDA-ARS-USMARC-1261]